MKTIKIISSVIIILFLVWLNYAFYKSNKKDQPRLFKPTAEKMKEFIPNTSIKKPDFSITKEDFTGEEKPLVQTKKETKLERNKTLPKSKTTTVNNGLVVSNIEPLTGLESTIREAGLINIKTVNNNILVDLKYSTTENFLGQDVYGDLEDAYLIKKVAEMLNNAQKTLETENSNYKLLVYDAVRPRSVQRQMWDVVKGTAQQRYVASPTGGGSMHNYGASVDLTIADENGVALDMGTPFDFFGAESQPRHEAKYLKSGKLSEQQINSRKLLRKVMKSAGFRGIQSEWWHFNAFSKATTRQQYKIIE